MILATDPTRRTNAQAISDADRLGFLPDPVIDPTYGGGGMWAKHRPDRLIAFDLDPDRGVAVAELDALPLSDGAAGSLVLDPPYKLGGTPTRNGGDGAMNDRFGIDRYRSSDEVRELYRAGMSEAARVVRRGGYVLVKCMDQQCGERLHLQTGWVAAIGEELPLRLLGRLNVTHHPRPQRSQKTPRNNSSALLIFRRTQS